MKKAIKLWAWICAGCLITPVLFFLAAFLSGGGHSVCLAVVLFPYAGLLGFALRGITNLPGGLALLIQFPLYGLILGLAHRRGKLWQAAALIFILHVLAVKVCFWLNSNI